MDYLTTVAQKSLPFVGLAQGGKGSRRTPMATYSSFGVFIRKYKLKGMLTRPDIISAMG